MEDIPSIYDKKAEESKKARKFEEALKFTDKAVEVKKEEKSENYWYKKAVRCCEFGEYEEAITCLDLDLSVHKKSYETYFLKGLILIQLKNPAEAIECFNKASEERNQQYLQNSKKVNQMKKAHKFEKALQYTDLAVNEKPLDSEFWHNKGIAFFKLKKYEDAHACFTQALEIAESESNILYDQAKCELALGNKEKCLEILEKSCKLNPNGKEKLKVDNDFSQLSGNRQLRDRIGF
jgi:tetratricopeptide (TPR) repeat protein